MDRPKHAAATKITDFRRYHLSGDLNKSLVGVVDSRVTQFEMASQEELQQQLEVQKAESKCMMEEVELMKLRHELDTEKMKQKQWQITMDKFKEAREVAEREHTKYLEDLQEMASTTGNDTSRNMLEWFKAQTEKVWSAGGTPEPTEEENRARLEKETRDKEIRELQNQQEQIAKRLTELDNSKEQWLQEQRQQSHTVYFSSSLKTPWQEKGGPQQDPAQGTHHTTEQSPRRGRHQHPAAGTSSRGRSGQQQHGRMASKT